MTPAKDADHRDSSEKDLTIEQLAARTGMTVRNIRAHQSRGLLPPPDVRSRVGYYGSEHVARLRLITEFQADGFNLKSIDRLLKASDSGEAALDFRHALLAPFETETSEILDSAELLSRLGGQVDPKQLQKATALGLVVPLPDGRFEVPNPSLIRAGEEVVALGVSLDTALAVVERTQKHSVGVAELFVDLFLEEIWKPFDADGRPEEQLADVGDALERLRPLASDVLLAVFRATMTGAVEEAAARVLGAPPTGKRRRGRF